MDFTLTDEQQMLREATRDLLSDHSTPAHVRAGVSDDSAADRLWSLGAELGWAGLALPEAHGGSGQGLVELALVAEELGWSVARTPFVPTVLVGSAVAQGGSPALQEQLLPTLADGSATGAWAFAEAGQAWASDGVRTSVRSDGDHVVLDGVKTLVQDADLAKWLLVTAQAEGQVQSFVVDADSPGITVRRQAALDLTRSFCEVRLEGVRVPADRQLDLGPDLLQRLLDEGAALTAADALGAGRRLLAMTVDYAQVRHQFGRAIGSFQAVKHKCATMRVQVQGAHAVTYYAAMAIAAQDASASRAASVAKAHASEAMNDLAGEALQVHGGIGFTWEHDLHLYLRRLKVDEVLHGEPALHHARVCDLLEQEWLTGA